MEFYELFGYIWFITIIFPIFNIFIFIFRLFQPSEPLNHVVVVDINLKRKFNFKHFGVSLKKIGSNVRSPRARHEQSQKKTSENLTCRVLFEADLTATKQQQRMRSEEFERHTRNNNVK